MAQSEENLVKIKAGTTELEGDLIIPEEAEGIVLFAHGSGSSRHSPRNRYVAGVLQKGGLATLLIDLLTREEEIEDEWTRELRFDIEMLAKRLVSIIEWLKANPQTKDLVVGLFGSSTGAAAALIAASKDPEVKAVVSRGGRPDLAATYLKNVKSPTLLIVGGNDDVVIGMNEGALEKLQCEKKLAIVPRATHLFEEPGTLEEVAKLAKEWFVDHIIGKG